MWRRLVSYEYLLEPIPGPPGQFRFFYLLLALGIGCALLWVASMYRKRSNLELRRALAAETILAVAGLSLVGCSFAGVPYLSMRILVFGSSLLALLGPVVVWVRQCERPRLMERHLQAYIGQLDVLQPSLPRYTSLLLSTAHLVGLAALAQHYRWPLWSVWVLLLILLCPLWWLSLRRRRWHIHVEALAPLFLVYTVLAARLFVLIGAKVVGYPHFNLPPVWERVLSVDLAVLLALPWSLSLQVYAVLRQQRRERALLSAVAAVWLLLSFGWAAYTYLHHHTHGVTGSDPYCYAQMAVDWVEHHAPLHRFPLVARMAQLGVFPEAGLHLGYHLPHDASGRAATVWPVGQSVLLALGYGLAGESGLYLTTPVVGLLSLAALAALGWELLAGRSTGERLLVSAVAVFLLATSYAQIERLVVPMADAAAQLFTTLTVWLWLRATRTPAPQGAGQAKRSQRSWLCALLAGLSFAAAYWVRHTQLVLGVTVLFAGWAVPGERRRYVGLVAVFALAAWCVAMPDLLYHQRVMGHWLLPESLELRHFSLAFMGRMSVRMARDLFSVREFLYVAPLMVYGAWRHWRDDRVRFGMLCTWVVAILLIHLPYEALRVRDLLSIFPALCWWVGYGVLGLWQWVEKRLSEPAVAARWQPRGMTRYLRGLIYGWLVAALLLLRTRSTLLLPKASDFDAFGHLNAFQRAGFAQIGLDTEETAWIGASLNSGSIDLHSERMAFRPALWRPDELYTFVDDAIAGQTPVYLLQDGLEMAASVEAARQRYQLQLVGRYDIPFYHTGGGSTGGRIPLYRVEAATN
jgi:hypothetical protein